MKKIGILGSTGSIGTQTLEVIDRHPELFKIDYLTANTNAELLCNQAKKYNPHTICIGDDSKYNFCKEALNGSINILSGKKGLLETAGVDSVDLMVNGLVGSTGMAPTINCIKAGVDIVLSNKESMVMAGEHINNLINEYDVKIFPMDSEHSAIWQCLRGEEMNQVQKLILTGSGGPFRTKPLEEFHSITKSDALQHPNWDMGNKITIDSATMMNKGLEIIEAHWLFNIPVKQIEVIVHPQSIIHSMVEFIDGSVKAQLGVPDMKIPIQYALTYPDHAGVIWKKLDLASVQSLTFEPPDFKKFPCLQLAYDALKVKGSAPVVLNVANDETVAAFLSDKIQFVQIPRIIEFALETHHFIENPNLDEIEIISEETRKTVNNFIKEN